MAGPANAPAGRQFVSIEALAEETLDQLAWRVTGSTTALAELMEFNPHLTMPHLPAGTLVFVPQRTSATPMRETIQLWS
jgi:phage tail protein X